MDAVTLALLKALGGGSGGSGLPSTDSASAGDVLSLDSNKDPQWATPSGGGGVLLVHDVEGTLDKTWQEIHDAALTDVVILAGINDNQITHRYLSETLISGDEYQVGFSNGESYYIASSASGYPVFGE